MPAGLLGLVGLCLVALPVGVYNGRLFSLLNGFHFSWTDPLWLGLTTLGDGFVAALILGMFLAINPRVACLGLLLLILSSLAVHMVKWVYPTLRPAAALDSVHVIGRLLRSGSFPSGHAATAMAAGAAAAFYSRGLPGKAAAMALASLAAISRVMVGAHFPLDVIGGAGISLGLFCVLTATVWPRWERSIPVAPVFGKRSMKFVLAAEFIAAVLGLLVYAPFYADSNVVAGAAAAIALVVTTRAWRGDK